jgi:hypothetical protein
MYESRPPAPTFQTDLQWNRTAELTKYRILQSCHQQPGTRFHRARRAFVEGLRWGKLLTNRYRLIARRLLCVVASLALRMRDAYAP